MPQQLPEDAPDFSKSLLICVALIRHEANGTLIISLL